MFYAFVIFLLFIGIMAFFIFANRPKMNVLIEYQILSTERGQVCAYFTKSVAESACAEFNKLAEKVGRTERFVIRIIQVTVTGTDEIVREEIVQ